MKVNKFIKYVYILTKNVHFDVYFNLVCSSIYLYIIFNLCKNRSYLFILCKPQIMSQLQNIHNGLKIQFYEYVTEM